jgi:hypothetical protein
MHFSQMPTDGWMSLLLPTILLAAAPSDARSEEVSSTAEPPSSTATAGQPRSALEIDSRRQTPRNSPSLTDRLPTDSPALRRSLFPTLTSPAVSLILCHEQPRKLSADSLQPDSEASLPSVEQIPVAPLYQKPSSQGALAAFEFTRRISADALRTANELERFGRRIMRGARLAGSDSDDNAPSEKQRRFEARVAPRWSRGPVAQFQFNF